MISLFFQPTRVKSLFKFSHLIYKFQNFLTYQLKNNRRCFVGFETRIGYVDVKSSPVYFYVQRVEEFNTINTPIPFDKERLNVGGGMDSTTGKFTAPRDGIYSFSFTALGQFAASSARLELYVSLFLNNVEIGYGYCDEINDPSQNVFETSSWQWTLSLQTGDQIWLQIGPISTGTVLRGGWFTHFSGYLMEENIAQSLISEKRRMLLIVFTAIILKIMEM